MHTFKAMNTGFLLEGFDPVYDQILEQKFHHYEQLFSRFIETSELSVFNRSTGRYLSKQTDFIACMEEANRLYKVTKGIFNPFMGYAIDQLGYNVSFENIPHMGGNLPPLSPYTKLGLASPLIIDRRNHTIMKQTDVKIDLGGFAKGWSAHQLKNDALAYGYKSGLIDAGGDIELWGKNPEGTNWILGVSDPFDFTTDAFILEFVKNAGVATSSVIKRRWPSESGHFNTHILDPETGQSTHSDIAQITVISENLGISEAFSKALLISGIQGISTFHEGITANKIAIIAFTHHGDIYTNDTLTHYIRSEQL